MAAATIHLCGELRVELGEPTADELPRGQIRILLAFLVLERNRLVPRSDLAAALWEDRPPARWDASLSALLSRLRRRLPPQVELGGRGELRLRLPADAEVDFELAERGAGEAARLLSAGDVEAARDQARRVLAIADGGFLPGHQGAWVEERRRDLEEVGLRALETIAAAALALGGEALGEGARAARRSIERDPYRETAYRHLMAAQEQSGESAAALRTFERLRTLLREELGTVPGSDLLEAHRRLLAATPSEDLDPGGAAPLPDSILAFGPLVGRREQLAELHEAWRGTLDGRPTVALLSGEAGIGKTRLCAELAAEVGEAGGAVLYGRCDEEAVVAFQPFVEALAHHITHADPAALRRQLDGGGGELARLLPQLARVVPDLPAAQSGSPGSERYRLFDELATLIRGLSRERPVLLVLDDLHWADAATIAMLRQLLREWRSARVLVVASYRQTELEEAHPLRRLLGDLPRDGAVARLGLDGLGVAEVGDLIERLTDREPPPAFAQALREETAGNPFFLREVLRHLVERGIVDPDEDTWAIAGRGGTGAPDSVAATISRRLDRLAPPTRLMLRRAAVIGREFPVEVLAALGGDDAGLPAALDEATAAGILTPLLGPSAAYEFVHALLQEAIYGALAPAERGLLHLEVGEAYEALYGERSSHEAELARHFRLAIGPRARERAIDYSVRAGRRALRRLAYEEAVDHLQWAVDALAAGGGGDEELSEALLELGRARNRSGQSTLAKDAFERAAELARESRRADLLCRAALGYAGPWLELGTVEERRLRLLELALSELGPEDGPDRAALMARLALEVYYTGPERRERLSAEAVEIARRIGDDATLARTLMSRRVAISGSPDVEERLAVSHELVALAGQGGARETELWGRIWLAADHLERADVDSAYRQFEQYAELATELRQPGYLWQPPLFAAMRALCEGRLDDIEPLMAEGLAVGARAHDPNAANYFGILGFMLRREQGRLDEVEAAVTEFVSRYPAVPAWRCGLILLHAELGRDDLARAELESMAASTFHDLPRDINWLPAMAWLSLASARLDCARAATPLYDLLAPHAARCVVTGHPIFCLGSTAHHLGLLARTLGRHTAARAHFETATAVNSRMRADALLAHTRHEHGATLLGSDDPADTARGEDLLALARADAERMGLKMLRDRIATAPAARATKG